jgi:hypothetical protein
MTTTPTPAFSNDHPLSSKADDKLNRAPFAERVAAVLRGLPKGAGLVIGIHGPWGDGKTTVLNMLQTDLDANEAMVTVEFNPWRFTDEPAMLAGFFRVLAGVIRARMTTKGEDIAGWIEKIGRYASVVDDRFGKAGDIAGSKAEVSLEDLRRRLSEALATADKRIVVLVDDIDRLDKHETQTLFRLIKACADFPNVCYVLAFDDVVVAKALNERYGAGDETSGRAFLEKIIQVPLKLPVAMKEDLRSLCFQQVEVALSAAGIVLSQEEIGEFISGFDRGVSIRLDTPRAAKRFGNGLMFALPMLKGEVNTVDLLLLEAMRAFYPTIYDSIRDNHAEFDGKTELWARGHEKDTRAATILKPLIDRMEAADGKAAQSLVSTLFPRMRSAFGGPSYGNDLAERWTKQKRVCSPEYCPRYFSYTVPKSDLRDSEMTELYTKATTGNGAEVCKDINRYFSEGKAKRVIERMRQQEEGTPPEAVSALCVAIAENAKKIPNLPALFSYAQPVSQAGILVSHLIRRLPAGEERIALVKQVIEAADPLWFGAEVIRWLYITDDLDKEEHNTLNTEEIEVARKILVKRIKDRAAAGYPLFDVDIAQEKSLLYKWSQDEGREPVQAHLASMFSKDPKHIALFLQAMAPRAWSVGDVLPRVGKLDGNQLKNIKLIYDLDALAKLIRQHLPGDFENPQWFPHSSKSAEERVAEQFMFVYNKWKKDGEPADPDAASQGDEASPMDESD